MGYGGGRMNKRWISVCCSYKPLYDVDDKGYGICALCKKPNIFKQYKKRRVENEL